MSEFSDKLATALIDFGKFNSIVNGASDAPDVATDGGPVPPVAKTIAGLSPRLSVLEANHYDSAITGSVTITSPTQHSGHSFRRSVTISGTYAVTDGVLGKFQFRHAGGDWKNFDATFADGSFTGEAFIEPGEGLLEVRMNQASGTLGSVANVAVGYALAIAGQSNARGSAATLQAYTGDRGSKMYSTGGVGTSLSWQVVSDPVGYNTAFGSYWPNVINHLEEEIQMPVILVLGATTGGSGFISNQWNEGDTLYESSVGFFNASGIKYFEGLLWDQGEAEAEADVSVATYKTYLSDFWAAMQGAVGAFYDARLFAVLIGASHVDGSKVGQNNVRQAVIELADTANALVMVGAPRHAGMSSVGYYGDRVHVKTETDLTYVGRCWARILAGYKEGGRPTRGPRFSVARVGGTGGLGNREVEVVVAGNDNLKAPSIEGFEFSDDTGNLVVESVEVVADGLRITVDRDLYGDVVGSYGKKISALKSPTRDTGVLAGLPLEPFYDLPLGETYATDLSNGLLADWPLDEASGNRLSTLATHPMVETGTVPVAAGLLAPNAAEIEDAVNYLKTAASIGDLTGGFAVSLWFKSPPDFSGGSEMACNLFHNLVNQAGGGQVWIYLENRSRVYAMMYGNGNDAWGFRMNELAQSLDDELWHHVYFAWDGDDTDLVGETPQTISAADLANHITMEIDGVAQLVNNRVGTNTWSTVDAGANPSNIGYMLSAAGNREVRVEQVRVWDRPLSAQERLLLRTSPGIDLS